jgi:hypothetical protein
MDWLSFTLGMSTGSVMTLVGLALLHVSSRGQR